MLPRVRCFVILAAVVSAVAVLGISAGAAVAQAPTGCAGDADCDSTPDSSDACPTTGGPPSNNGCPTSTDTDRDGVPDSSDACPNTAGSASNGCPAPPDTDRDGVPDSSDACPNTAGPPDFNGCPSPPDRDGDGTPDSRDQCPDTAGSGEVGCPQAPRDSDGDGVPDESDLCPRAGNRFAGQVRPDGCPPLWVYFRFNPATPAGLADDRVGGLTAFCVWNGGKKCVMHATLTLSAKSARAAGLKNRVLMDRKIQLTTKDEKRFAGGYQTPGRYPVKGKLNVGLSPKEKRKLRRLRSVTLTARVTYTFGSKTVDAGSNTATLKRGNPTEPQMRARSLDVQNRKPTWQDERAANVHSG